MVFDLFPQFYSGPDFDLFRRRKRLSVQRADAVICVSNTTCRDVLRFYELDADRVHVVPNARSDIFKRLDSTELSKSSRIEQPFLLYIGNRARYKSFDILAWAGVGNIRHWHFNRPLSQMANHDSFHRSIELVGDQSYMLAFFPTILT